MQVSVVIPVYNAERFVAEAVRSALDQPETAEVLLVEDGSPDGSLAICRKLAEADPRVRLLRHPGGVNRGAGATRNLGIREARSPFVAFLDADDLYLPGRFRAAADAFVAHPEADGVYGAVAIQATSDEMLDWQRGYYGEGQLIACPKILAPDELFDFMLERRGHSWHTNAITVRRELFERTGPFDEHLRLCQDMAMWFKMAAVGTLLPAALDVPVSVRRLHGENRVVQDSDTKPYYRMLALRAVAAWARDRGLPEESRQKLLRLQISDWDRTVAPRYRFAKFHRLAFLGGLAVRQPIVLRRRFYYAKLYRAVFTLPNVRRILVRTLSADGGPGR